MKDNSPIVLHIKAGDTAYDFFLFSMAVYDILLYDKGYNPYAPHYGMPDSTQIAFNRLQGLFLDAPEKENGEVVLSFDHLLILLSTVDHISKAFLDSDAERLINYLVNKFPGLEDEWVTSYLQNAGYIFGEFRQQFGDLPKMEALLQRITNLNRF